MQYSKQSSSIRIRDSFDRVLTAADEELNKVQNTIDSIIQKINPELSGTPNTLNTGQNQMMQDSKYTYDQDDSLYKLEYNKTQPVVNQRYSIVPEKNIPLDLSDEKFRKSVNPHLMTSFAKNSSKKTKKSNSKKIVKIKQFGNRESNSRHELSNKSSVSNRSNKNFSSGYRLKSSKKKLTKTIVLSSQKKSEKVREQEFNEHIKKNMIMFEKMDSINKGNNFGSGQNLTSRRKTKSRKGDRSFSRRSKTSMGSYRHVQNFDSKFGLLSSRRSRVSVASQSPLERFKPHGKFIFGNKSSKSQS